MARFWGLPLSTVNRMTRREYLKHRNHWYDHLEYQQEAIERAKEEAEGGM